MGTTSPAQSPSAAEGSTPPAPDLAAEDIRRLNEAYIAAARDADVDWFRDHMADDAIVILGDGRRLGKAEFLETTGKATRAFRSLTVRDVTVRTFGGLVQVDADAPWELEEGGKGVSRYVDTYAWLDGRWQVVSAQITFLPGVETT